jgi:type I restriction enzyme, S subunit
LMADWNETSLAEVVQLKRGIDLPTPQRRPGPYPVLGSSGISGWHDQGPVSGPGVTIGRSGASIGVATWYDGPYWPLNTTLYVEDFKGNDPRFIFRLLDGIDFAAFNSGSAQPSLNRNFIAGIKVRLPGVLEQRKIAAVLGALDDKIAVNQRIAATAEDLALALASAERWQKSVCLEEVCSLRKEQVSPQDIAEGFVDHYSLPAFDAHKMPERIPPEFIKSGKFSVTEPAVLISKLNPDIPRVWNVAPDSQVPSLASTEFLILVPRGGLTTHELWAVTRQQPFLDALASKVTGTSKSHQRVRPVEVMATEVVDPRHFGGTGAQIQSSCIRAALARQESRTLCTLRDTLLPQLMSGRLRIKDAEKIVEDAV